MKPGEKNLITDIKGLKVGNAEDHSIKTGVTVLSSDKPFVAGVSVMGGAPGTRETDLLAPDKMVQEIDALVLSGGSAFGLAVLQMSLPNKVEGLKPAMQMFQLFRPLFYLTY